MNKKCLTCSQYQNCKDNFLSFIFFIIGIISAIAIRLVTILADLKPIYGQFSWYVGVLGFLIFFVYKFIIEKRRQRLIKNKDIMNKIAKGQDLTEEERKIISDILCSLTSDKDKINYFVIFFTSAIALIMALYLDFFK